MKTMKDIRAMSDTELTELVMSSRETMRKERFKDQFSRKKSVIVNAKMDIARALTEQTARRTKIATKTETN